MEPTMLFNRGLYALATLVVLNLGSTWWTNYKSQSLNQTIKEQLEGKLSEQARVISQLNAQLNQVESRMVTQAEVLNRTREVMEGLDENTRRELDRFLDQTNARIDSIGVRFTHMETRLNEGIRRIGGKVDRAKTPPPPSTWKGVSKEDQRRCADHPERCEPFEFSWESPYKVNGSPLARFSTPNLWDGQYALDLNLAFKVVTIGYSEDPNKLGSGAAQNQGVHIYAGYVDPDKGFVSIAEQTLLEGDPNLKGSFTYTPKVDPSQVGRTLKLFEPSLLLGSTYQSTGFGLSIGASMVNLVQGKYRLGANVILTEGLPYLGVMGTYHMMFAGKALNVAPGVGWVYGSDGSNTWSIGLHFQAW